MKRKCVIRYIMFMTILFACLFSKAQSGGDTTTLDNITSDNSSTSNEVMVDTPIETAADSSALRTVSDEDWKKMKEDKGFIYTEDKNKAVKQKKVDLAPFANIGKFFNSTMLTVLMFLLVAILLVVVVYHLFFSGGNYFGKRKSQTDTDSASFENVAEYSAWDQTLKEALDKNDYRLAVRVLYLQTLQQMHQQGWILFEQEKTNWDYVQELKQAEHLKEFTMLTTYFDYIWYGHFDIEGNQYQSIELRYRTFQQEIR